MNAKMLISLTIVAAAGITPAVATAAGPLPPYSHQGEVLQTLRAFDNPEAAIFSADGRYVFVSNAAELGMPDKGFHLIYQGGFVMVDEKLLSGLTGPLGMAVSTVATDKFPAGTVFLAEASPALARADGTVIKDPALVDPKILAFNTDGQVLGAIKLGAGSVVEKSTGLVGILPNALAFDRQGNLYLAETGIGGGQYDPPVNTGGGVYMFPRTSLDALAQDQPAPFYYLPVPDGGPDGIEVGPTGIVNFNTVGAVAGLADPAQGGMYHLRQQDFESGTLPRPFQRDLGALDGLDFAGTARVDTEIKNSNSVIVTPFWTNHSYQLTFDRALELAGPADIAIHKMSDGSYLLVIPELSATSPNNMDNPVVVVRLPQNFDQFPTGTSQ